MTSINRRGIRAATALTALAALVLSGCASASSSSTSASSSVASGGSAGASTTSVAASGTAGGSAPSSAATSGSTTANGSVASHYSALVSAAQAEARTAAGGAKLGGTVTIVGVANGAEGDDLVKAMKPFEDATGVTIKYTGSEDQTGVVQAAVLAGNPPDIVDGQGAGIMKAYAAQGKLKSMDDIVGADVLKKNFNSGLLDGVTVNGKVYGIWGEVDAFMVWYNAKTYAGPKNPTSYAQLDAWAKKQAASGTAPWCMALEAGAGTGFPAQSWIENIFLKMYGPTEMAKWANGQLPWTSPEVKAAFQRFGEVATSKTMVNGGPTAVVSTSIVNYGTGLFSNPNRCSLELWGNYAAGLIQSQYPSVKIPADLDFFPVPADTPSGATAENIAGHVMFAFNDAPQTKAFLKYWASPQAASLVAATGRWSVGNRNVPLSAYPNPAMQRSAELLTKASVLSPGPATTAPSATVTAWNKAIINYVQDPSTLDDGLASIQATASGNN
jgi:alpha-glucoside transport system substrate-binding protein